MEGKMNLFTRLLSAVTAIGSAVVMLPAIPVTQASANTVYDLMVGQVQVTDANAADILGDGVFRYDAANNTLTVSGDAMAVDCEVPFIRNRIDGLTLNVASDSMLATSGTVIDTEEADMTITGNNRLLLNSSQSVPINSCHATLTFYEANLDIDSLYNWGGGGYSDSKLNFVHSTVHSKAVWYGFGPFGGIEMRFCRLESPGNGTVKEDGIYDERINAVKEFTIVPEDTCELYIWGEQVTYDNAADILGYGNFSYEPLSNTLTIDGADMFTHASPTIVSRIPGLIINTVSDSCLSCFHSACVQLYADTVITGAGKLKIETSLFGDGIVVKNQANLTVKDTWLEVDSMGEGIIGNSEGESLTIDNAHVLVESNGNAVSGFTGGLEIGNRTLIEPANGSCDSAIHNSDGSVADHVLIEPFYDLFIIGVPVNRGNAADILGNGVFSYDAETNTLTIDGDYSYVDQPAHMLGNRDLITNNNHGLTINVASDSTLMSTGATIDSTYREMTITGSGKLTLQSDELNGTIRMDYGSLTIKDANLNVGGMCGICADLWYESKLTIINSTIHMDCEYLAVSGFKGGIELQKCHIENPSEAYISEGSIKENEDEARLVDIVPGTALAIKKQPENLSAYSGETVKFSVQAEGEGRLTYEWQTYYNGQWETASFVGYRTPTLAVPVKDNYNGTRLRCVVRDENGHKVISNEVVLTVKPKINTQPVDASGCIGDKVQFSVDAAGVGLIYQWQYYNTSTKKWENTGLAGNKTKTLTVSVTSGRNNMKYHCIVKDANGEKLVSGAAKLTVNPKIIAQPVDASGCIGDKVQFTVEATGVGLIYQWQYYNTSTKKWENTGLAGNKTATLTVTATAGRNNMKYHCIVKDSAGTKLTSTAAKLIVNPKIVTQPEDASGALGDKVQFKVDATGAGLIYQWQYYNTSTKKWENTGLTGNNTAVLTVTVTSSRDNMKYHCIVKDANGTKLTSAAATLKVLPKIVTQPKSVTAAVNSTAKFTVEATGIGLVYQWQYYNTSTKKWENTGLAGNKTATLSVTAISFRNGMKYHCIVKDSAGNKLTSTAATLTVK